KRRMIEPAVKPVFLAAIVDGLAAVRRGLGRRRKVHVVEVQRLGRLVGRQHQEEEDRTLGDGAAHVHGSPACQVARMNICLANGFTGKSRYNRIRNGITGSLDLIVNGRKRGRTSVTWKPWAARKS